VSLRMSQLTTLRFLLTYVVHAQPLASLAASWPKLLSLLRRAFANRVGGCTPPLLLLILGEMTRRMVSLSEVLHPFSRLRERREAIELSEDLIRATGAIVGKAKKPLAHVGRLVSKGHGDANGELLARDPQAAPLPSLDPHSTAWEGDEAAVVALVTLERCLLPLLTTLYTNQSARQADHAIELVAQTLPSILAPLEQRILELPRIVHACPAAENGAAAIGMEDSLADRKAEAALRVLLQVITMPSATRAWRSYVGRLFGLPQFFAGLTRRTLPLWARAVNAWLALETPKAAVATLLSGKLGKSIGWLASKASEAEAFADCLRRLSFALWVGEFNQYVGALQGMLIEKVVAAFKFGTGSERADGVRWVVQVQALLATRVLAMRVASEHLTALWPIVMAELQRILLLPCVARPALLLAACQLIDTVLTVLPDEFSPFGWMFVPHSSSTSTLHSLPESEFAALLDPLARLAQESRVGCPGSIAAGQHGRGIPTDSCTPSCGATRSCEVEIAVPVPVARRSGLLKPSSDGRRRPLLGLRSLQHASCLAPFAAQLRMHLSTSALLPRATEIDVPTLELLIGCEFLSAREADAWLEDHQLLDDHQWLGAEPCADVGAAGESDDAVEADEGAAGPSTMVETSPCGAAAYARHQRCTPQEHL